MHVFCAVTHTPSLFLLLLLFLSLSLSLSLSVIHSYIMTNRKRIVGDLMPV